MSTTLTRREALKLGAATLMAATVQARAGKKVIVAGGGIGGLCCGYELMKRGHEVVVLEAAGRTGGHVFTFRDGLDDGLYADAGAEHFTNPGYDRYRAYVEEFKLPYVYYPRREHVLRWINGTMHTEEMLADPKVLAKFGLNQREIEYVKANTFPELAGLYYKPYMDAFRDEYKPFDAGLNHLDNISTTDLFKKDGASAGALNFIGGGGSALQSVWHAAILKLRGVAALPAESLPPGRRQPEAARRLCRAARRSREAELASDEDRARADRRARDLPRQRRLGDATRPTTSSARCRRSCSGRFP